jgi:hypothetical protein
LLAQARAAAVIQARFRQGKGERPGPEPGPLETLAAVRGGGGASIPRGVGASEGAAPPPAPLRRAPSPSTSP